MNREIKFRAKSKSTNTWLYGDLLRNEQGVFAVVPPFKMNMSNECNLYEVDEETVGQFTGLYDKAQKPIYEGDILRIQEYHNNAIQLFGHDEIKELSYEDVKGVMTNEWIGEVGFEESAFFVKDTYLSAFHGDMRLSFPMYEVEVIGTIYDNANLLEE